MRPLAASLARHSAACMQAAFRIQRPSGSISRLSSAIGMNSPGSSRPRVGVLPADERLDPDQPLAAELEDRLVVQDQLVVSQRSRQRLLELHPLDHRRVHLRLVDLLLALALGLRSVEREVGVAQQVVGLAVADRDPDAGADEHLASLDPERLVHDLEDAVADRADVVLVDVLEQDDELVAAEARRGVGGADARGEPGGGLAQQLVARGVPEGVVDVLEHVEVDEQDGRPGLPALGARERMLEPIDEQQPVRKTRERVVERLVQRVLDRLRVGEREAGVLGEGDEHLALGLRVDAAGTMGGDDEAADDLPALAHRRRERRPDPVGRERAQAARVGGVVLDHDQPALGRGAAAGALAQRAPSHLRGELGLDPGRGGHHELPGVLGVEQPQADRLVAEQVPGAGDDRLEHLLQLPAADDRALDLR